MPTTDLIYLAVLSAADDGGAEAVRDLVITSPMIAGAAVVDLERLCGTDVPARTWDTELAKVTTAVLSRLDLIDDTSMDVTWPERQQRNLVYAKSMLPVGGAVSLVAVTDDGSDDYVALLALGDDSEQLQMLLRIRLDSRRYRAGVAPIVQHISDTVHQLTELELCP